MDSFWIYLQLGFQHILDINGADHMLFVISLCSLFCLSEWKKVLILVTAFTIGHSLSLTLSVLNFVLFASYWIELVIPITILITALINIWNSEKGSSLEKMYWLPALFGVVHGLGFSNYLKSLLGTSDDVVASLFAFNIGIELGQLIIVVIFLILLDLALRQKKIKRILIVKSINSIIALVSLAFIFRAV